MKDHEEPIQDISFVPVFENIDVEYDPGTTIQVTMHDGSHLRLTKLEEDYDPTDRVRAITRLHEAKEKGEMLTGVFYVNPQAPTFLDLLHMTETAGYAAGIGRASEQSRARRSYGRTEIENDVAGIFRPTHLTQLFLACGASPDSPVCSGLSPGSGKSVSADFSIGSWLRWPSWPCMEVFPLWLWSSCSTPPFSRSWSLVSFIRHPVLKIEPEL